MLKKILFTMLAIVSSLLLFADLEVEPGFNYNMVGPAYSGEVVNFISDTLYVSNTGITEEFTLHLETSEIPDGWNVLWCHEYEDALCHFPVFPWSFSFLSGSTIQIDFTINYNSSPGALDLDMYWESGTISEVMNFTFRTEDFVDNEPDQLFSGVELSQNYPNPFNPETTIDFNLTAAGRVELNVYNLKGELVKTLVEKELAGGNHSTHWNGADNQGNSVPSGLYFYRLQTSQDVITRRMILLK
jgi:hypothetical protein